MPASCTPIESTTAMQPAGMSSIAARVEIGEAHDSGVARSSRAGTKRSVNARATNRGWPGRNGRVPRSQTLRRPFFSRIVVSVAVVTCDRMAMALASSCMSMAWVMGTEASSTAGRRTPSSQDSRRRTGHPSIDAKALRRS